MNIWLRMIPEFRRKASKRLGKDGKLWTHLSSGESKVIYYCIKLSLFGVKCIFAALLVYIL